MAQEIFEFLPEAALPSPVSPAASSPSEEEPEEEEEEEESSLVRMWWSTCRTQTNADLFRNCSRCLSRACLGEKIVLSIKIAFKGVLRTGPDARLRKKLSSFRFPETRAVRGLAGVPGGGRGWCCSVTVRERPAQKRVDLFCSTFPMFVPSLSWQNDDF
jgi:hypothetical protein